MHKIGEILRNAREDMNLTLPEAAKAMGLSPAHLSQLEVDTTYLSDHWLNVTTTFYGIDREFLLRLREKKV